MHRDVHYNPNEFFPLRGKLGAPGDGAKAAALIAALAMAAAAWVAMVLGVICTPLFIGSYNARIEAFVSNWEPGTEIYWVLTHYEEGQEAPSLPLLDEDTFSEERRILDLTDLQPETWYALWFYNAEDTAWENLLLCFDFCTGKRIQLPEPPGEEPPPVLPPEPPKEEEPPAPPEEQTPPPEPPTPPTEETPPPTNPPAPPVTPPAPPVDPPEEPPTYLGPEARTPERTGYTPPVEENMDPGSYLVRFAFDLNDATPTGIEITGQAETYENFNMEWGIPGSTENLTFTFGPEDITVDTATNRAWVEVNLPSVYKGYTLTGTMSYDMADGTNGTVTGDTFALRPTYLYGQEAGSANAFAATLLEEVLNVTLTINDFYQGDLEYRVDNLELWVDYDGVAYELSELITMPELPTPENGTLTYQFTISPSDPNGDGSQAKIISFDAYVTGDTLLDGQPMGIPTESYARGTFILGESYPVEPPTLTFSDSFVAQLQSLGLEPGALYMRAHSSGTEGAQLSQVVPGDTVDVWVQFDGTAIGDFQLTPNITFSPELAAGAEAESREVYDQESYVSYIFTFTMPEGSVSAEDILIGDFLITLPTPPDPEPGTGDPTEGETTEEPPAEGETGEAQSTGEQPSEEEPAEGQPAEGESIQEQPAEGETTEGQPVEGEPAEAQPTEEDPTGELPPEGQPAAEEPTQQPSEEQPAGEQPIEGQPPAAEPTV